MSRRRLPPAPPPPPPPPSPGHKTRPLPPVPLLFSSIIVGSHISVLERGEGAEWCPQREVGVCGLDRPLGRGEVVRVEVGGTGYFHLLLQTRPLSGDKKRSKSEQSDVLEEVRFKLKRSEFHIEVRRASRSLVHLVARPASANGYTSARQQDVKIPHDLDLWVTFNVMFGDLRITLKQSHGGKIEKPLGFDSRRGLNIKQKSKLEVRSLRSNPCAIAVTERPVTPGETVELRVLPQDVTSQTEVTLFLTQKEPHVLELQNPSVYFNEKDEVYSVKKFLGTLLLRVDVEKDCLEIEERPENDKDSSSNNSHGSGTIRSLRLSRAGLHVRLPMYVCVALLRTSVTIVSRGTEAPPLCAQTGYARFASDQVESKENEYLALKGDDNYLTPISDLGPPPHPAPPPPSPRGSAPPSTSPPHPHVLASDYLTPTSDLGPPPHPAPPPPSPRGPAPPSTSPPHPHVLASDYLTPTSRMPQGSASPPPLPSSPRPSPGHQRRDGARGCLLPSGPERPPGPCGPGAPSGAKGSRQETDPYLPMDGYVRPSPKARSVVPKGNGGSASCADGSLTSPSTSSSARYVNGSLSPDHQSSVATNVSTSYSGGLARSYTKGCKSFTNVTAGDVKKSAPSTNASGRACGAFKPVTRSSSGKSGRSVSLDRDPNYLTVIPHPWEASPSSSRRPVMNGNVENKKSTGKLSVTLGGQSDLTAQPWQTSSKSSSSAGGNYMKIEPSPVVRISPRRSSEDSASPAAGSLSRISKLVETRRLPKSGSYPVLGRPGKSTGLLSAAEDPSSSSLNSREISGSARSLVTGGGGGGVWGSYPGPGPVFSGSDASSPPRVAVSSTSTQKTPPPPVVPSASRGQCSAASLVPQDHNWSSSYPRAHPRVNYQNVASHQPGGSAQSSGASLQVTSTHRGTFPTSEASQGASCWPEESAVCGGGLAPFPLHEEQASAHPTIVFANEMV
ncbi:hypothetical protein ACOMHN_021810 [Nucella lapillus]